MNQEIIQAIAGFLGRTPLQASEIEAYQACQRALQQAFEEAGLQKEPEEEPKLTSV